MVGQVADLALAVVDLAEAEGVALRRGAARGAFAAALAVGAAALAVAGLGAALWGLWLALQPGLGPAGAALVVGLISAAVAGGLGWVALRVAR